MGYSLESLVSKMNSIITLPKPDFYMPLKNDIRVQGSSNATFTRASEATYSQLGILKYVKANEPRFEKEGLLVEGASTNKIPNSLAMRTPSNGGQPEKSTVVVSPDKAIDGISSAYRWTAPYYTASGWQVLCWQDTTTPIGTPRTNSIWLKGSGTVLLKDLQGNGHGEPIQTVVKLTPIWTRYQVNIPSKTKIEGGLYIHKASHNTHVVMDYCFPQIEELPFASSYIPTKGSAVTRAADNLTINYPITPIISTYIEFDVPANAIATGGAGPRPFADRNNWSIYKTDRLHRAGVCVGGGVFGNIAEIGNGKWCLSSDGTETKTYADRKIIHTANKSPLPSNEMRLGSYAEGGGYLFGHIKNFKIWNQALTPDQIELIK